MPRSDVCPSLRRSPARRRTTLIALTLGCVVSASAEQPFGNNWKNWGAQDEVGTLNYVTPEIRRDAAKLVREGRVWSLAVPLKAGMPAYPGRAYLHFLAFNRNADGPGQGGADDAIVLHPQYTTQWDGLAHVFGDGKTYGGHRAADVVNPDDGARILDVDKWRDRVVTRGVLLDVARFRRVDAMQAGEVVTVADLEGAAKAQGVEVRQGDCILVRTGYVRTLLAMNWPGPDLRKNGEPGLGIGAAEWLKRKKAACVAVDNLGVEVLPAEPEAVRRITPNGNAFLPIHVELIVNQGMAIGEMFYLEELAADSARDGIYEFLFVAPPLRIVGGIGTPINPQAIR